MRFLCKPSPIVILLLMALPIVAADKETREPSEPSFSADGLRLVYVDEVAPPGEVLSETSEIWTVDVNGSNSKRLTQGFSDEHPRFSPDGRQIVFQRDNDIWMIQADGTGLRNISGTEDIMERGAVFSSDGQSLFWVQDEFGLDGAIVQQPVAGGEKRERLSEDFGVAQIVPGPDDKTLLALCNRLTPGGNVLNDDEKVIAAIPLDGNPPRTIYDPRGAYEIESFCAGGGRVAVVAQPKGEALEMNTYLLQNGALEKIEMEYGTGFSADGKTLVGTDLDENIKWGIAFYYPATKARTFLKEIAKLSIVPVKAEEFWRRGTGHYKAARYDEALKDFNEALRLDPKLIVAYFNRALTHEGKGNLDLALKDYEAALKVNPKYINAHLNRGVLLKNAGRTGEALDAYSKIIELDAKNDKALFNRGLLYLERLEPDAALKDFDKAISFETGQAIYYAKRGEANFAVGDHKKALADYNKAIDMAPEKTDYYRKRSKVHAAMGQKTLAEADETKANELEN